MPTSEEYIEVAAVITVAGITSYYGMVRLLSRNVGLHNDVDVRFAAMINSVRYGAMINSVRYGAMINSVRYGAMAGLMALTYRDTWPVSVGIVALTLYNHAVQGVIDGANSALKKTCFIFRRLTW